MVSARADLVLTRRLEAVRAAKASRVQDRQAGSGEGLAPGSLPLCTAACSCLKSLAREPERRHRLCRTFAVQHVAFLLH